MTNDNTSQLGLRTTTIVLLGGLVVAGIGILLHDPAGRTTCERVAHDSRVRRACLGAAKWVGREVLASMRDSASSASDD